MRLVTCLAAAAAFSALATAPSATTYTGQQTIGDGTLTLTFVTDGSTGKVSGQRGFTSYDFSYASPEGSFDLNSSNTNIYGTTEATPYFTVTNTSVSYDFSAGYNVDFGHYESLNNSQFGVSFGGGYYGANNVLEVYDNPYSPPPSGYIRNITESGSVVLATTTGIIAPTPPPATVPELLQMSSAAYTLGSPQPNVDGFTFYRQYQFSDGFSANVYRNGERYVVAVRGTDPDPNSITTASFESNIRADVAIGEGKPTDQLSTYVADGTKVVSLVKNADSNAQIEFTGHSLGGSIAEILGFAAKTTAVGFDSPGIANVASAYSNVFGSNYLGTAPQISTYRYYGDQISLVGAPVGAVYTATPNAQIEAQIDKDLGNPGKFIPETLAAHDTTALSNVINNTTPGELGPNILGRFDDIVVGEQISVPNNVADAFGDTWLNVAGFAQPFSYKLLADLTSVAGVERLIDPSAFIKLEFTLSDNLTSISGVSLSEMPGLKSYELTYRKDGSWSPLLNVVPGTTFSFLSGVNGFEFTGTDDNGQSYVFPDTYLFGVTLADTGEFSAEVDEELALAPAPEPSTWMLMLGGVGALGFALRRRKGVAQAAI